jgi:hypothetical protein
VVVGGRVVVPDVDEVVMAGFFIACGTAERLDPHAARIRVTTTHESKTLGCPIRATIVKRS